MNLPCLECFKKHPISLDRIEDFFLRERAKVDGEGRGFDIKIHLSDSIYVLERLRMERRCSKCGQA
jgi:hypothetical protein